MSVSPSVEPKVNIQDEHTFYFAFIFSQVNN